MQIMQRAIAPVINCIHYNTNTKKTADFFHMISMRSDILNF